MTFETDLHLSDGCSTRTSALVRMRPVLRIDAGHPLAPVLGFRHTIFRRDGEPGRLVWKNCRQCRNWINWLVAPVTYHELAMQVA
jgi:hypothetical protein